jgi:hypothetical protein
MWLFQALLGGSIGAFFAGSRRIGRSVGFLTGLLGGAGAWMLLRYRGSRLSSAGALSARLQALLRSLYLLSSLAVVLLNGAWMLSTLWLVFHLEPASGRAYLHLWQSPGPWLWGVWLVGVVGVLLLWLLSLGVLVRDHRIPSRGFWLAALVVFNFVAALWWLSEPAAAKGQDSAVAPA